MKKRLLPVVASLCGLLVCATGADANTVYVHNKPVRQAVTINKVTYVPFSDFLTSLRLGWTVDEKGDVVLKPSARGGDQVSNANFNIIKGSKTVAVKGMEKDGAIWVPVRLAEDLGFELSYNSSTEIIDIVSPRLINDQDREAADEVNKARAAKEALLAEQAAEAKAAYDARKQAMAEKKAKMEGAKEGEYDADFEARKAGEAAARAVAKKQKQVGEVTTYADLMAVQKNLDEQEIARLKAISDALNSGKTESSTPKAEKAAPAPAPNVIAISPRANVDLFTGTISMSASIRNVGNATAKGISAKITLVAPDGTKVYTNSLSKNFIEPGDTWTLSDSFDHPDGGNVPRGNFQLIVEPQCVNAPK